MVAVKGSLGSKMKMSSMPSWRQAAARRDAEGCFTISSIPLADVFSPFNLFRYLTFRSIAAFLTALVLSFLIGGGLIRWLRSKQGQGQPIRDDGPASHLLTKKGTPTMGGLLILIALTVGDPAVGRPHQPLCLGACSASP